MTKRTKLSEFNHFNKLANEWWSESGKYKILHKIMPIRIKYILNHVSSKNTKNLEILDLGCGGGLVCEPLAKLGFKVTGIDFVENNIKAAKLHALQNNLKINYYTQDIDDLSLKKKYDLIILFEVLEHIDNWGTTLFKIKKFLKKGGLIILSTINRNIVSNILAIKFAENVLRWVPKNTHKYNKLITPEELEKVLIKENFSILDFSGLVFNPLDRKWRVSKNIKLVNYFCTAKLN